MHVIIQPFAIILSSVCPLIKSLKLKENYYFSTNFVIIPFPRVLRIISPSIGASALFFPMNILAIVLAAIVPSFDTLSMLQIIFPFSLITGSIYMDIGSETVCFVKLPFTFEDIAINMIKLAFTMGFVVLPFA
jgi:hypothetical protein